MKTEQEDEEKMRAKSEGCMSTRTTQIRAFEGANMHKSTFHYVDNPRRSGAKTDGKEDEDYNRRDVKYGSQFLYLHRIGLR